MSPSQAPNDAPQKPAPLDKAARAERRRSLAEDALNIPNLLTMARVVMIPIFLFYLDQDTPRACFFAALIYTAAALTDALDGYLARKLGVVSVLGKFLDPLADKLIVMAGLVWMVPMGRIQAWVVVVLLSREMAVNGLRTIAASEGVVISAGDDGKIKTALQMIGIIALVIGYPYRLVYGPFDLGVIDMQRVGRVWIYLSLVFSVASAAQYTRLFAEAVDAKDRKRSEQP